MSQPKNQRQSQWRVVRRCMDILLYLLRQPATADELRTIIQEDARSKHEPELSDKALQRRFDEDKKRLQEWFQVELRYNRSNTTYELYHIGCPLFDLPEDNVRALAFLQQTYSDDGVPMATEVRALLSRLMMVLPDKRRRDIQSVRGVLEMALRVADNDQITMDVWEAIKTSTSERRQLEFDYHSLNNTGLHPRRHIVEPIRYFFDTMRKHYYLECFSVSSSTDQKGRILRFRPGRMSNPRILPTHFPANRRIPTKELVYELSAVVARQGVTRHFPDMHIQMHEDGSATVTVASQNLFFDLRTLLHYSDNCKVIGGTEAVREMKTLVQSLHQRYMEG